MDAGIATIEQFRAATEQDALVGRLRKNVTLRRAPAPKRPGKRGRSALHGPVLHPGAKRPEGRPDEDTTIRIEEREVRVRRWRNLHFRETPRTLMDVVRVDDPAYKRPLLIGTTARELTTDEIRSAYAHRWPIETNFYVAQGTCAMEMPRAWSATAVERRISLALLGGLAAQGDCRRVRPAADGAVGREGRLFGWPVGQSLESPCPEFCDPCAPRPHSQKVPENHISQKKPLICSSPWLLKLVKHVEGLKGELIKAERVAADEGGEVLVWVGRGSKGETGKRGNGEGEVVSSHMSVASPQPPASYTPAHLAERIRAASLTDGERKTITALFADLKGSTALIEGLDPEEARAIIDPALQLMMDAVHRYEGYVAQALGDGIFALFGAPIAHEDHPQRALYAALRMQEEMRRYGDHVAREQGIRRC